MFFSKKKGNGAEPSTTSGQHQASSVSEVRDKRVPTESKASARQAAAVGSPASGRPATSNGAQAPAARGGGPSPSQQKLLKQLRQSRRASTSFGVVLRVLSSDAGYQGLPLSELRWLVTPSVVTGQFRAAESLYEKDKEDAGLGPVAVVSWALLSPALDNQLRQKPDAPLRLTPAQWKSGDIPWIMLAAGRKSSRDRIIQQLLDKEFKGRDVIVRQVSEGGKVSLAVYNQSSNAAAKGP